MYTHKPEWSACVYIRNLRLEVFVIDGAGAPGGGVEQKKEQESAGIEGVLSTAW